MNSLILYSIKCLLILLFTCNYARSQTPVAKHKPSALFVFGDSTVDAGNNNFIRTSMKSNFPPYGRDFINHIPTGRFTNGRLVSDFIASYTGVKEIVPPYLDPSLTIEDLMTGVCFASAGTGFDPLTATISSAIALEQQMEYFREYKSKMQVFIGKERTLDVIKNAIFMMSAGTNDFIVNYFAVGEPVTQVLYPNVTSYQNFLFDRIEQFLKELMGEGARKIAMVGLPPMGCLPEVITWNRDSEIHGRTCVESMLPISTSYNVILQNRLKALQTSQTKVYYADIYTPILDMIQFGKTKLGFENVNTGCCGTGYVEASMLCNMNSGVCDDASKYVFWDAIHPTEQAYYYIFTTIRPVVDLVVNDTLQ